MIKRTQSVSLVAGTWSANTRCAGLFLLLLALLPFPHATAVGAGGFVASSEAASAAIFATAAAGCRSRSNPSLAAHPAERKSRSRHRHDGGGMKPAAAYCFRSTPLILQLTGRREEVSPAKTMAPGSRAAAAATKAATMRLCSGGRSDDGILAPVKEKMKMRGEGDDELDTILLYFAFGANMCPSVLLNSRGVTPFESFPAEAKRFATGILQKREGNRPSLDDEDDGKQGVCLCFCHRAGKMYLKGLSPPGTWRVRTST